MKMSPDYGKAFEAMAPGKISAQGFLGDETLPLPDIIARDETDMSALGLDFNAVAVSLERLAREGEQGLGAAVTVDDTWLVTVEEARGVIPCPFRDLKLHKRTISVTRVESNRTIVFSDLSLHLLRVHHFLQGRGSPYRLEPETLRMVLAL